MLIMKLNKILVEDPSIQPRIIWCLCLSTHFHLLLSEKRSHKFCLLHPQHFLSVPNHLFFRKFPSLNLSEVFSLLDSLSNSLVHFCRNTSKVMFFSVHCIRRQMISTYLISDNFSHLVKVVSAVFFHYR